MCSATSFFLATGLTPEPNLPVIAGLNWTAGSSPHNSHAKDVGKHCGDDLGYLPVPDRLSKRREKLLKLKHATKHSRCVPWRYTGEIIFF